MKNELTDSEVKLIGMQALIDALGEVEAARFVSLILREPFDYTEYIDPAPERRAQVAAALDALARTQGGLSSLDPLQWEREVRQDRLLRG